MSSEDDLLKLQTEAVARAKALRPDGRTRAARREKADQVKRRKAARGFGNIATQEEFDARLAVQGGRCYVCRRSPEESKLYGYYANGPQPVLVSVLCRDCRSAAGFLSGSMGRAERLVVVLREAYAYGTTD